MPERLTPGPVRGNPCIKEAVCVHTRKVYDSCRDKECVQDLRVYLTCPSQEILERASSVKPVNAKLLWVYVDVDRVQLNNGFYAVDTVYYYRIRAEAICGSGRPAPLEGVAACSKRVILFGSEGSVRTFSSGRHPTCDEIKEGEQVMPTAVVEAVEPILLSVKCIDHACCTPACTACDLTELPGELARAFDEKLSFDRGPRGLYATLGQFSIVKLERGAQLCVPCYGNCMPDKECRQMTEDPCDVFDRFCFPDDAFNPPDNKPVMNCGCQET